MELFDSHAHYNDEKFEEDREEILKEIYKSGVTKLVNAGYSLESSKSAIQIANSHDFIYSTVGISPNDIADYKKEDLKEIENLAKSQKVVAIGEIGLDYYWNKENKEKQKELFIKQLEIAKKYDKAVIVHTRDAINDSYEILKEYGKGLRIDIHCFAGSVEMANKFIGLGAVLGIGGVLTFKNAKKIQEVVEKIDLKHFVLETDSPYLTPEPFRGKRNEPYNIYFVAKKIAEIKGISIEEVFTTTTSTAIRQFDLKDIMC